jgi:V-type H+-transporting ATPase subunit d
MSAPGSLLSFNINDGFIEGILRGFRLGLLSNVDYSNLTQCDALDGSFLWISAAKFFSFVVFPFGVL